jgi:hypothetical protein
MIPIVFYIDWSPQVNGNRDIRLCVSEYQWGYRHFVAAQNASRFVLVHICFRYGGAYIEQYATGKAALSSTSKSEKVQRT